MKAGWTKVGEPKQAGSKAGESEMVKSKETLVETVWVHKQQLRHGVHHPQQQLEQYRFHH